MSSRLAVTKRAEVKKKARRRIAISVKKMKPKANDRIGVKAKARGSVQSKDRGKVTRQSSISSGKMRKKTRLDDDEIKDSPDQIPFHNTYHQSDISVVEVDPEDESSDSYEGSVSYTDDASISKEEGKILRGSLKPEDARFTMNADELRRLRDEGELEEW